ncbi:hypothetical protein C8Q78DRAFT_52390 [Trametes maxima]|nr:hypothetical protein C8Q78DRAFT_52390 [Trametes maxima]
MTETLPPSAIAAISGWRVSRLHCSFLHFEPGGRLLEATARRKGRCSLAAYREASRCAVKFAPEGGTPGTGEVAGAAACPEPGPRSRVGGRGPWERSGEYIPIRTRRPFRLLQAFQHQVTLQAASSLAGPSSLPFSSPPPSLFRCLPVLPSPRSTQLHWTGLQLQWTCKCPIDLDSPLAFPPHPHNQALRLRKHTDNQHRTRTVSHTYKRYTMRRPAYRKRRGCPRALQV